MTAAFSEPVTHNATMMTMEISATAVTSSNLTTDLQTVLPQFRPRSGCHFD